MTKTAKSEVEAKSRANTGARSTSIYVLPEERELWERVAAKHGLSMKDAVIAGLRALEARGAVSDDELLALLAKRLRRRG